MRGCGSRLRPSDWPERTSSLPFAVRAAGSRHECAGGWASRTRATASAVSRGDSDDAASAKITEFVRDLDRVTSVRATGDDVDADRVHQKRDWPRSGAGDARRVTSGSKQSRRTPTGSAVSLPLVDSTPIRRHSRIWLKKLLSTPSEASGVTLATVHRVKGLEWPHVIVYDASFTVFPAPLERRHRRGAPRIPRGNHSVHRVAGRHCRGGISVDLPG